MQRFAESDGAMKREPGLVLVGGCKKRSRPGWIHQAAFAGKCDKCLVGGEQVDPTFGDVTVIESVGEVEGHVPGDELKSV